MGSLCRSWLLRMPYATLVATILCLAGVGVFCGCVYRAAALVLLMFAEVFDIKLHWLEPVQLVCVCVAAAMALLALLLLLVGCVSTGATRSRVFRSPPGRARGRTSCALFMGVAYVLEMVWLVIFALVVVASVVSGVLWRVCQTERVHINKECIDLQQFSFVFPASSSVDDMQVCDAVKLKMFCTDFIYSINVNLIISAAACFLVLLSLVNYLMCLAANYAHIKDQEKFEDISELQYLQATEPSTIPKTTF